LDLKRSIRDREQRVLLRRARRGDERAFRRLYRQLHAPVAGYVFARVRPREDAEDLVSIIFHRFLESWDAYDPSAGSVWTWVMTMTRHRVIDHYRTRRGAEALEDLDEILVCGQPDPELRMIQDEEARFLDGILRGEEPQVREAFALRYGQGMSYREIAQVLGISEAAVKQRFSRTLRRLRDAGASRTREGGERNDATTLENRRRAEDPA
jgi:RNA polymerase sigma-70 factor (ECF subfamily)